ncbi:hypothetical protein EI94DRAFT_1038863 [Lactarius quietus]|nr:hypothetical protein EI94DRAFT_1038863 [Lactarius quietus]
MSIKSGQRYKITNEQAKLVVDLSGGDGKSIIGWTFHDGENQQWITEKQYDGKWTIRSVGPQKYIAFVNTPENGTALVGLDEPQLWDIKILNSSDPAKTSVKYAFFITGPLAIASDFFSSTGSASLTLLWSPISPWISWSLELVFNSGRIGTERIRSGCSKSVSHVLMKSGDCRS